MMRIGSTPGGVLRWSALMALAFMDPAQAFDLQGHRGARGHLPENTLPAFEFAIRQGATTLETDLALTRDGVLVLSHDPVLNPDVVRGADGKWLTAPTPSIRSLTLEQVRRFDVGRLRPGSTYAGQWPDQQPRDGERIPTFQALLDLAARLAPKVHFNIETKLSPHKPDETVDAEMFAAAVVAAVLTAGITARVTVQSFDWRTWRAIKRRAPEIATSCLTVATPSSDTTAPVDGKPSPWLAGLDPAVHGGSMPATVKAAGCSVWSPLWRNVTTVNLAEAKRLGLAVVPWTVNGSADMEALMDLGVDGLITDYPDRTKAIADRRGLRLAPFVR